MDEIDRLLNAPASQLTYNKLIDVLEAAEESYQEAKAAFHSIQSELDPLFDTKPNQHKHALDFVSKEHEKLVEVWKKLKPAYLDLLPGTTLENFREDCQKACNRVAEQKEFAHLSFATKETCEAILKHAKALATWDSLKENLRDFLEHVADFDRYKRPIKSAIDEIYNREQSSSLDQLQTFLAQIVKLGQQGNLESVEKQMQSWETQLSCFNPNKSTQATTIATKIKELYEFINDELYPCYTKVEPQKLIKTLEDSIAELGDLETEKAAFACWKLYGSDIRAHDRAYKIYEAKMTEISKLMEQFRIANQSQARATVLGKRPNSPGSPDSTRSKAVRKL